MANVRPLRSIDSETIPDAQNVAVSSQQTPLLVLSRNAQLLDTVRRAAPQGMPITQAAHLDKIADELLSLQPGVLLIDMASTSDAAALLEQLTQHFPELVIVAAGQRDDSTALMQLTATGRIFRFLLTPLSHGQTRLALEAAGVQHAELKASSQRLGSTGASGGGNRNYVVTYGALAAGLLVAIGAIWTGVRMFTAEPTAPPPALVANSPQTSQLPARPDPLQAELQLANDAFAKGRFIEPRGESALDLYRSALAIDPKSEAATAGVRSVTDRILERAEAALTAERLEEAIRNIETARDIDAKHPRLPFLDTQIAREHERLKLSQARDVGNRVRTLVAQADARMQQGRLIAPANSNARDALFEARRLDPTDPTVAQGLRDLNASLTEAARTSLAAGKKEDAQAFVNVARELGAAGPQLAAIERALAEASRPAPAVIEPPRRQVAVVPAPEATVSPEIRPSDAAVSPPPLAAAVQAQNAGPVQAGTLTRIREVPPRYPPQALADKIEGWVDIDFTISPEGVPQEVKVRDARPRRIFDRAAIVSVQQWRFQPIVMNGAPVEQAATLRVRFALK